jgi:hypothetical protein
VPTIFLMLASTRILVRRSSGSAYQAGKFEREAQAFADGVAERLASNKEACSSLVEFLDDSSKQRLFHALLASESSQGGVLSKSYLDKLFEVHDTLAPLGQLQRCAYPKSLH